MAAAAVVAARMAAGVTETVMLELVACACDILTPSVSHEEICGLAPCIPFLVDALSTQEWEDALGMHSWVSTLIWKVVIFSHDKTSKKLLVEGGCITALFQAMKEGNSLCSESVTSGACAALEALFAVEWGRDHDALKACKEAIDGLGPEHLLEVMRTYPATEWDCFENAANALCNLIVSTKEAETGELALMQRIMRTNVIELLLDAIRDPAPKSEISGVDPGGAAMSLLEDLCESDSPVRYALGGYAARKDAAMSLLKYLCESDSPVKDAARKRAVRAGALQLSGIKEASELKYSDYSELYNQLAKTDRATKRRKAGVLGWDEGGYAHSDDFDSDGEFYG